MVGESIVGDSPRAGREPRSRARLRSPRPWGLRRWGPQLLGPLQMGREPRPRPLGVWSRPTSSCLLLFGRSTRGSIELDSACVENLPSQSFIRQARVRCCPPWVGLAGVSGTPRARSRSVWRNANLRWLELAWTRIDRRPVRVPGRGLGLRIRHRRREGGRTDLPRSARSRPRSLHRSRGCSATATRASASCSSRTSPASCSSALPRWRCSLDADRVARVRPFDRARRSRTHRSGHRRRH